MCRSPFRSIPHKEKGKSLVWGKGVENQVNSRRVFWHFNNFFCVYRGSQNSPFPIPFNKYRSTQYKKWATQLSVPLIFFLPGFHPSLHQKDIKQINHWFGGGWGSKTNVNSQRAFFWHVWEVKKLLLFVCCAFLYSHFRQMSFYASDRTKNGKQT